MSSKVELVTVNTPLNSSSFQQQINNNFTAIEESLNKQLQREPQEGVNNAMQQEIDMNSNRIINLAEPVNPSDAARFKEVQDVQGYAQEAKDARDEAVQAKEDAVDAKEAAEDAKTDAVDAKEDAEGARDTAVQAKEDAVAAKDDITTLLTEDYPEITTVANNIADVQTVAAGISDVSTVAGVATEVAAVGAITADVTTVAGNTSDISTVAGISSDVSAVAGVASDISTVEGIASDVTTVAGIASDVTTVAGDSSNISTVAGMSSDISDVVTNMTAIQGASQNASDAANSATLAQEWATKMDGQVASTDYSSKYYASQAATSASSASTDASLAEDWATKTDGLVASTDYSSKYYAQQAAAIVATLGSVLVYKGSVATYADLPATGNHTGDVWNVLADGKNYAWDGTAWDDFGGAITVSIATASDVDLTNLQNGEVLIYNSTTQKWENGTVSGGASSLTDIAVAGDNITFTSYVERNYTPNGNVTVNSSGVASGFSARTDYLKVNYQFAPGSSPWKMFWKVKTGNSYSASGVNHCVQGSAWSGVDAKHVQVVEYMGNWYPGLSSNGTSWDIGEVGGSHSILLNTDYWLKLEFTGTNYILSYSLDGETWVEDVNIASTTPVYQQSGSSNYSALGSSIAPAYADCSWEGTIDLTQCYYEIDGIEVWRAYVDNGKYSINASYPTGTLINTATGSNSLSILGSATSQSNSINIGATSSVSNGQTTAIGYNSKAYGSSSVAIGYKAYAYGGYSIYIGQPYSAGYSAEGSYSICVGYNTRTRGGNDIALGYYSNTYGGNCIAIGSNATSSSNGGNCIAIGNSAQSTGTYAIQLGQGTNSTANTFSVGLSSSNNYQLLNSSGEIPEARMAKVIISGASDPTTATVGTVGQLYKNTTDGGIFKCTDTTGSVYTWEELGAGGSSASYDAGTKTITL